MKHLLITTLLLALPAVSLAQTTTTNTLELTGPKAGITAPGSKPVVIRDKAQIEKRLDLRGPLLNLKGDVKVKDTLRPTIDNAYNLGSSLFSWATLFVNNITLPEGGLVDGVDVSELATNTEAITTGVLDLENRLTEVQAQVGGMTEEYDNVLAVAKSGATYTTITAAVNAITAAGDASDTNPYVIAVAPGTYNESVVLPDYTHLVGAATSAVVIMYDATELDTTTAVIHSGYRSSVQHVTLVPDGPSEAIGVYVEDEFTIRDVDIYAEQPTANAYGIYINENLPEAGVVVDSVNIIMDQVSGSGTGIYTKSFAYVYNSRINITNSEIAAGYILEGTESHENLISDTEIYTQYSEQCAGVVNNVSPPYGYVIRIKNSTIDAVTCSTSGSAVQVLEGRVEADASSIYGTNAVLVAEDGTFNAGASMIDGAISNLDGTIRCVSSYNSGYVALADTCAL